MADPNTQIDWWIAQTWQEAQGGADNDALVAWLHENGLTAPSSYTILQAALSCPSETAKEIVFSHPAWAGAEADSDVDSLDYTNDTLEPEPEPDPTFELDDWAEQVEEEAPVYGEEGFQPDPNAGASPPSYATASMTPTGTDKSILLDPAQPEADEPAPVSDPAMIIAAEAPAEQFADPAAAPSPEEFAPAADPAVIGAEDATEEQFADPASVDTLEEPVQVDSMPPAAMVEPIETARDAEQASAPAPDQPPAPVDAVPLAASAQPADDIAMPLQESVPDTGDQDMPAGPPAPETADIVPAEPDPAPPQPAMAAAPMPAPLVYTPMPELQPVQPVAPAAPLFALPQRDRQPPAPLFPPAAAPETADNPQAPASNGHDPDAVSELAVLEEEPKTQPESSMDNAGTLRSGMQAAIDHGETEPRDDIEELPAEEAVEMAPPEREQETPPQDTVEDLEEPAELEELAELKEAEEVEETENSPAPALDEAGDIPPGMLAAMGQSNAEPLNEIPESSDEETGEPAPTDWEQELPPLDDDEEESEESVYPEDEQDLDGSPALADNVLDEDEDEDEDEEEYEEDENGDTAPRPRKQVLLDLTDEAEEVESPGDTPEEMAAAAKELGIDFRGGDPSDAGADPEMAKAAKELGISFREGSEADAPLDDEAAIEAQKLGISFREVDTISDKPPKLLVVKYLPMLLGVIFIFFLLLLGATFAGDFIGWLKS